MPVKPFSVNATFYRDQRVKTADFRAWEKEVLTLLEKHPELKEIGDAWKDTGGVFKVEYTFVYPTYVFYTKSSAGTVVSARAFDITNTEKTIQDLLFRYGMGVDDRFIVQMISKKTDGADYRIDIAIELVKTQPQD